MNSCNSPRSNPSPLLAMVPAEAEQQQRSSFYSQLSTTTSHFGFGLPDGWLVEEKRRPLNSTCNPGKIDKFYIEPEKGLKFRSLGAVHEYLAEGQIDRYTTKLKPGSQCIKQYNPRSSSTSSFMLPDDWIIEERPRKNPAHIDRYYIEPGTGLKFRSRAAVQRYLTEGKIDIRTRKPNRGGEYINQFAPRRKCSSSFILPDDWVIEEKPRPKNPSHIDKYYIEPGTGQRFRSLASVESYLSGANDYIPLKALMPANVSSLSPGSSNQKIKSLTEIQSQHVVPNSLKRDVYAENSRPPQQPAPKPPASSSEIQSQQIVPSSLVKRNICGANDRLPKPQAPKPPEKVHWVLDGPAGEDKWFPFIGNSQVPESVMGNWAETFISTMYHHVSSKHWCTKF